MKADRSLKIAFDAKRIFHNREGLGSYARTLLAHLSDAYPQHSYYLCTPTVSQHAYAKDFLDKRKYNLLLPSIGQTGAIWRSKSIIKDLETEGIDIYIGLSNELPFGIKQASVKSVVVIHDVLYKAFPQQFSAIDRWIYNKKFKHAIGASDLVLTTSEYTKGDILKHFEVAVDKIQVAYQPVSKLYQDQKVKEGTIGEHFLVVGTINERKNLELVIQAYALLSPAERKPVVVVGTGGKYKQKMLKQIEALNLSDWFDFKGQVSTETLVSYYKSAIALVFPSKYEGFGRPILEALSLRVPVITGQNSSLPEVAGKYGIIIEYDRAESLKQAMLSSLDLERKKFFQDVESHLGHFSPTTYSKLVMSLIYKTAT